MISPAPSPARSPISGAWRSGQSIFTPQDITANPAPPDQHPYAGWLYMQIMIAWTTIATRMGARATSTPTNSSSAWSAPRRWASNPNAASTNGWTRPTRKAGTANCATNSPLRFRSTAAGARWRWYDVLPGGLQADLTPSAGLTLGTLRDEARVWGWPHASAKHLEERLRPAARAPLAVGGRAFRGRTRCHGACSRG